MAVLKRGTKEISFPDYNPLREAAKELEIPFGCHSGICGTCRVHIIQGLENLTDKTEVEKDMDLLPDQRLMCQSIIKQGTVTIRL